MNILNLKISFGTEKSSCYRCKRNDNCDYLSNFKDAWYGNCKLFKPKNWVSSILVKVLGIRIK